LTFAGVEIFGGEDEWMEPHCVELTDGSDLAGRAPST
jgi:hypothetical protein